MKIECADVDDANGVMQVITLCKNDMLARGIDQWDDAYPAIGIVREDVRRRSLFIVRREGRCVASVCLNDEQPEVYRTVAWRCLRGRALVVHRLCVHPGWQRRGLGRGLMTFAETVAKERAYSCVRLEAYSGCSTVLALYDGLAYQRVGEVRFPGRRLAFVC
jgi:ribosomal protein S18 acetylase RimI-like enzyme